MELSMHEKQAVVRKLAMEYKRARKKEKGRLLNEVMNLTGYHRGHAARALRLWGKKILVNKGGQTLVILPGKKSRKRKRKRVYAENEEVALKKIWCLCDCPCGKRLAPYMEEFITVLERHGEIKLSKGTRKKLCRMSAATIDRMLRGEKKKTAFKGRSYTKPGSLLKSQIPIRTFKEWNKDEPGFLEVDLVGHEGGNSKGEFLYTLDAVDIYSRWTEIQAVKNKAERWVFEALMDIRLRLPFPLVGLDSDNGSEFINDHLARYCEKERITFTRGRPYHKNDNCYVEQKNYTVVRRFAGYARYETEQEQMLLNAMYQDVTLYTNFFQPVRVLVAKERIGSKIRKRYDEAKTPFKRLLTYPKLDKKVKQALKRLYLKLNPVELLRRITEKQKRLRRLNTVTHVAKKMIKTNTLSRTN